MAGEPQGLIHFDGIDDDTIIGWTFTHSRGVSPGICLLRMVVKPPLTPHISDLVITYDGGVRMVFPDCAVNTHSLRREKDRWGGWLWSIQIMDRRWEWRYKEINGEYNVRMPDDTVRYSNTHPELRKNLRELAEACLDAMEETGYDVSALPTDVWPYVNWKSSNPALELEALCSLVACTVVYDWEQDRVVVCHLGTGDELPVRANTEINIPMPVGVSRRPDKLAVACGPTLFELTFKLKAVGRDTDGEIKFINDLSFAPSSWGNDWWCSFPGVGYQDRHEAYETVWRWYRLEELHTGGLHVPGIQEQIESIDQFVIEDGLVVIAKDPDEMPQTVASYVNGIYWPQCDWSASTTEDTIYEGKFKFLDDRKNIIEFDYPILNVSSGGTYTEPTIYLTTRCKIRNRDGDGYIHNVVEKNLPWPPSGAGARILKHPELWAYELKSKLGQGGDNYSEVDAEAQVYLDMVANLYEAPGGEEDKAYAEILPIVLDGAIAQVQWKGGIGIACATRMSRLHEFDIFTYSHEWRRRFEKIDTMADEALL